MAKITYHNDLVTVCGAARTLFVSYDGSEYEITQFAHVDDSGNRKRREWGRFPTIGEATKAAEQKSDSQYGA